MEKTIKVLRELHLHFEGCAEIREENMGAISYVYINNNWYCLRYGSLVKGGIYKDGNLLNFDK